MGRRAQQSRCSVLDFGSLGRLVKPPPGHVSDITQHSFSSPYTALILIAIHSTHSHRHTQHSFSSPYTALILIAIHNTHSHRHTQHSFSSPYTRQRLPYTRQRLPCVTIGVSPEYENEYDSYFVVRGGVETTVICDHIFNNS